VWSNSNNVCRPLAAETEQGSSDVGRDVDVSVMLGRLNVRDCDVASAAFSIERATKRDDQLTRAVKTKMRMNWAKGKTK